MFASVGYRHSSALAVLAWNFAVALWSFGAPLQGSSAVRDEWEIPFTLRNDHIIIQTSVGNTEKLRFLVDTGATDSLIDKNLVKKLQLDPELNNHEILTFGQGTNTRRFYVRDLRIGPMLASVHCYEADLSTWHVHGILGLDLLRFTAEYASKGKHDQAPQARAVTVDYDSHTIHFGSREPLPRAVPMIGDFQLVVAANVEGKPMRLVVDTGSNVTVLFGGDKGVWKNVDNTFAHLGNAEFASDILFQSLKLGNETWKNVPVVILPGVMASERVNGEGVLALSSLHLKALRLDFEHNVMSWK